MYIDMGERIVKVFIFYFMYHCLKWKFIYKSRDSPCKIVLKCKNIGCLYNNLTDIK